MLLLAGVRDQQVVYGFVSSSENYTPMLSISAQHGCHEGNVILIPAGSNGGDVAKGVSAGPLDAVLPAQAQVVQVGLCAQAVFFGNDIGEPALLEKDSI